jgi:hypothetical protein
VNRTGRDSFVSSQPPVDTGFAMKRPPERKHRDLKENAKKGSAECLSDRLRSLGGVAAEEGLPKQRLLFLEQSLGEGHQLRPRPRRGVQAPGLGCFFQELALLFRHPDAQHVGLRFRPGFPWSSCHSPIVATKNPDTSLPTSNVAIKMLQCNLSATLPQRG